MPARLWPFIVFLYISECSSKCSRDRCLQNSHLFLILDSLLERLVALASETWFNLHLESPSQLQTPDSTGNLSTGNIQQIVLGQMDLTRLMKMTMFQCQVRNEPCQNLGVYKTEWDTNISTSPSCLAKIIFYLLNWAIDLEGMFRLVDSY